METFHNGSRRKTENNHCQPSGVIEQLNLLTNSFFQTSAMAEELEMPKDPLTIGLCTALDVQLDSLKFHLDIFIFLSSKICSKESCQERPSSASSLIYKSDAGNLILTCMLWTRRSRLFGFFKHVHRHQLRVGPEYVAQLGGCSNFIVLVGSQI